MKPTATKIIAILAFGLIPHITFALTETVDGVTWHYYVTNGCASLGRPHPSEVSSLKEHPLPAHEGNLPTIVVIPDTLGGHSVTNIGDVALQITKECGVELVIVPESIKTLSACAFVGEYVGLRMDSAVETRGEYEWKVASTSCNIKFLFKGDCPKRNTPGFSYGKYFYVTVDDTEYFMRSVLKQQMGGQFYGSTCYVVEGTDGWNTDVWWAFNSIYHETHALYGAAKIRFLPEDELILQSGEVALSCPNDTAQIYYTLDGSEPTTNVHEHCFLYTSPIELTHRATIKALAFVKGYPYTIVYSNEYAFGRADTPIITAENTVFNWPGNMVSLSTETEDAEIRYTLDGSEPTEGSALYTEPFAIDDTTTVKAKAFKTDWFESETVTETFTRKWYTVETPVIEPSEAEFANASQEVSISCGTEDATIWYTLDGSAPGIGDGLKYEAPFTIYRSCTVKAVAVKDDWKRSAVAEKSFVRAEGLSGAANMYGQTMETDGSHPWTVDYNVSRDGISSVRSGSIDKNGMTGIQASVKKAGTVSFWWRARCEEPDEEEGEDGYYDYGVFLVDDVAVARIAGNDTGWVRVEHSIATGGKHILRWEYRKDNATTYAPDCIWLDCVQWLPVGGAEYTTTTPTAVPFSWLDQYGLGFETDYETAAMIGRGKGCVGGTPWCAWQDYVAGTDPTNTASAFITRIDMTDGVPRISWEPDLNTNGEIRVYKVWGKESLSDPDWEWPTNSLHRFFKVSVEMP